MARKHKSKTLSWLRYTWGEALHSKHYGTQVRFLRWLDADETRAEVATLGGIKPLPGWLPAADLSRSPMPVEPFQDVQASAALNAACDDARRRLKTV